MFTTAALLVEAASDEATHLRPFCRFALPSSPSLPHSSIAPLTSSHSSELHRLLSKFGNLPQTRQQLQQPQQHHGLLHALQLAASLPSAGHARVVGRFSGVTKDGEAACLSGMGVEDVAACLSQAAGKDEACAAADPDSSLHTTKDFCGRGAGMALIAFSRRHHHHHHQQQQQQQQQISGSCKRARISLPPPASAAAAAISPAVCTAHTQPTHAAAGFGAGAVGAAPACDGTDEEGEELDSVAAPRLLLNQWQYKHEVRRQQA
eukprot:1157426-Pelagomonas_calceolata.AAC.9